MLKIATRWLKNDPPYDLEFEGFSEGHLFTRTGTSSSPDVRRRLHSPKDLVALGIAGCTGVDVVSILQKMRQPIADLIIELEIAQTTEHPRVFNSCKLNYRFSGTELDVDRVARATALSYGKYCGVSAMIKRSGCQFEVEVRLNEENITSQFEKALEEIDSQSLQLSDDTPDTALMITGNEIILGKTQETNSRFLAQRLLSSGLFLSEIRILGDERQRLVQTLQDLLKSNGLVIITGGLGPTKDDLTREVVAEAISRPLVFSPDAWDVCVEAFKKMGRTEVPESNKKQAYLPEGAVVLQNEFGTAAGFVIQVMFHGRSRTIVALPGVPWECEAMFQGMNHELLPFNKKAVREWGPWIIWGMGESAIQSAIKDAEDRIKTKIPDAEFSFQADAGFVTYLIRSRGESSGDVDLSDEINSITAVFGNKLLFTGGKFLTQHLMDSAQSLNLTLSLSESCTGGRILAELTKISGSSCVLRGGIVAYSNESKIKCLGVSPGTLDQFGAVSQQTAVEMADGALVAFDSQISLSVTGIAGPSGGSASKPVGTVCFGLSLAGLFGDSQLTDGLFEDRFARLKSQGWALVNAENKTLSVEKSFGSHLSRDLIQRRATLFGLCSLVAVCESLKDLSAR